MLNFFDERLLKDNEYVQELYVKILRKNSKNYDVISKVMMEYPHLGTVQPGAVKHIEPILDHFLINHFFAEILSKSAETNPETYKEVKRVYTNLMSRDPGSIRDQIEISSTLEKLKVGVRKGEKNFLKKCFIEAVFRMRYPLG
jgi:hypothetical protein